MYFRRAWCRPAQLMAVLLSCLVTVEGLASVQTRTGLSIVVVEGQDAIHDIRNGSSGNPMVEVRDDNDRPVSGARITFTLPERGASGSFFGAGTTFNATTNAQGRATGTGFQPNTTVGRYRIHVTAIQGDRSGSVDISQSNAQSSRSDVDKPKAKFWRSKVFAVIVVGGIVGAVVAAKRGDDPVSTVPPTTITPGTISVGTPR
jgi:hypothetical protein